MKLLENKKLISLIIVLCIVTIVAIDLLAGKIMLMQGIPAGAEYLNTYELLQQKSKAKNGDINAVKKLYDYYSYYKNDTVQARKWLEYGANLGDAEFQNLQKKDKK